MYCWYYHLVFCWHSCYLNGYCFVCDCLLFGLVCSCLVCSYLVCDCFVVLSYLHDFFFVMLQFRVGEREKERGKEGEGEEGKTRGLVAHFVIQQH